MTAIMGRCVSLSGLGTGIWVVVGGQAETGKNRSAARRDGKWSKPSAGVKGNDQLRIRIKRIKTKTGGGMVQRPHPVSEQNGGLRQEKGKLVTAPKKRKKGTRLGGT